MKKIFLALIILIIVGICIPAVSAEEFREDSFIQWSHPGGTTDTFQTTLEITFSRMYINDVGNYPALQGFAQIYPGSVTSNKDSDSTTFVAKIDGKIVGSGVITYNKNYLSDGTYKSTVIGLNFDDWDVSGYTGKKLIDLTFDKSDGFALKIPQYSYFKNQPSISDSKGVYLIASGPSPMSLAGSLSAYGKYSWALTADYIDGIFTINRHGYPSYVTIINNDVPNIVFYSKNAYNDLQIDCLYTSNIGFTAKSPAGVTYNRVYVLEANTNTIYPVTVYAKNSQTYALIADSHIVISASVDNEFHEVINQTLPSGTYIGDLQPTGGGLPNPDFYRLITTAEGYNSIMPYLDFEFDEAVTIYDYLDPIGGAPEDENNTFIDFFVRDMSANPISGATVNFGGYTLITNSAGYTIFEVDKSKTYSWTVSKSGYGSLTGNVVIGDDPRHTINTVLAPAVTPTIPTAIPTSTPISPTPTMTSPTGEPVSNWLEWFAAHFGMILGGGAEIGKIFMWLCFSVPVGVYVGKESKAGAAGFMAGAGIVTLFFVLIGWVPIWLLVLIALIVGLLYAKVFNNSDNGGGR